MLDLDTTNQLINFYLSLPENIDHIQEPAS